MFDIIEQMEPAQSDEGTDKQIRTYGNINKCTADGQYKVYIDDITKNFVIKDLTNGTEEQFEIPDQYFNNLKDELNSGLYWELIGNGIGLYYTLEKGYYNGFVYFSFKDHGLFEISMPIKGFVSFRDGQAFVERAISYRFNSESLRFEVYYERPEYEYHSSIIYQGNFYYDDDEVVLFNADQSMLDNTLFKPYSELPEVYYNDHKVGISSTVQTVVDEYVKIDENSFVGIVKNNEFEPIIEIPVRRFDGDEHGIVYTGYEEDGLVTHLIGGFDNKIVFNDAYEGPGTTWLVDEGVTPIDYSFGDEAYTIMVRPFHQLNFILFDHLKNTISYIYNSSRYEYIIKDDGIYFNTDEGDYILPFLDGGKTVVIKGSGI